MSLSDIFGLNKKKRFEVRTGSGWLSQPVGTTDDPHLAHEAGRVVSQVSGDGSATVTDTNGTTTTYFGGADTEKGGLLSLFK